MKILRYFFEVVTGIGITSFVVEKDNKTTTTITNNDTVKILVSAYHPKLEKWQVAIKYISLGLIKFHTKEIFKDSEIEYNILK